MPDLLMLPGGERWTFEYWRVDWKKRPSNDKQAIDDWLWERDWAMLEAFERGLTPQEVARHFGITVGRLRMVASRVQWRTAAFRLDFVDDPTMLQHAHEDIALIDSVFGWQSIHERIEPLRGVHLSRYYESKREWIPKTVARKMLPYLRFYTKEAQERLKQLARGGKSRLQNNSTL